MKRIYLVCLFKGILFQICNSQLNLPTTSTSVASTRTTLTPSSTTTTAAATTTSEFKPHEFSSTSDTLVTVSSSKSESSSSGSSASMRFSAASNFVDSFTNSSTTEDPATTKTVNVTQNTKLVYYTVLKPADARWVSTTDADLAYVKSILENDVLTVITFDLSSPFIFYGHQIKSFGITTSGFLFTNEFLYNNLAFSHYIAPLMAYFDTIRNPMSAIKYFFNDTMIIVWYENMNLYDRDDGALFTFQVILYKTGNIVFNYKNIPINFNDINDTNHKVTAGVSDAYAMNTDDSMYVALRVYNRVELPASYVVSNSTVMLNIVETCLVQTTCTQCFEAKKRIPFNCQWCPALRRCSDGLDRQRQEWLKYSCPTQRITNISNCDSSSTSDGSDLPPSKQARPSKYLGLIALLFLVPLIALVIWVTYSVRNPTSSSGQCFLRNGPSKWGERIQDCWHGIKSKKGQNNYVTFDQPHSYA